jgi:hypothetical protein
VNAVRVLARRLPWTALARLGRGARTPAPGDAGDRGAHRDRVTARHERELAGLLNALTVDELAEVARATLGPRAQPTRDAPSLRRALWRWGAELEAGGPSYLGTPLQPIPAILGGRLVHQAPPRGQAPPASSWPRPLPPPVEPDPPASEPDTLDELLAAADRALGVRLGPRGIDKGAWGTRAAALLGVVERKTGEPDWRGDVEVKTVPIARDPSGLWRVTEDPAISMATAAPLAKLQRVLWLARADVDAPDRPRDATIVSWYLLDWDPEIARLVRRDLHSRPKGPRGTSARGLYLHKRFFAAAGLLATLNGPVPP